MARKKIDNDRMREEKKNQILAGALQLFATKGLFATKIKDIAETVGMAQGLIYHYYKSKDEIYVELINNALDKMNEAVLSLKETPLPAHIKISMAIEELIKTIKESEDFTQTCRLIAHATNSTAIPEEAKRLINEKRDIPYIELAKIIAEGQGEGRIVAGEPMELSVVFWTFINGLATYKATRQAETVIPDAKLLIKMFIN